jgi:hypothetical protein
MPFEEGASTPSFAVKRIAEVLGVSRSNLLVRRSGRTRPRGAYRKADDEGLLPLIRRFVDERPTYGYRRIIGGCHLRSIGRYVALISL